MTSDQIRVLYIAGWGRSGSTIIGNILGQMQGTFHAGELWYLWERGMIENRLCGCGKHFSNCSTWQSILDRLARDRERIPAEEMVQLHKKFARTRRIPALIRHSRRTEEGDDDLQRYLSELRAIYHAIHEVTNSNIVIDSSKMPSYALLVGMLDGVDLFILHLVRDPRATGYSWLRRKYDPAQDKYMRSNSLLKNAILWITWNVIIERIWNIEEGSNRYLRVRYEDFARTPVSAIEAMTSFLERPPVELIGLAKRTITLTPTHTVSGNPVRVQKGSIEIREDREWFSRMKPLHKFFVTSITWPLLQRYGYPLFP